MNMKFWAVLFSVLGIAFSGYGQSTPSLTSNTNDPILIRLENLPKDNPEEYRKEFLAAEKKWKEQRDEELLTQLYLSHLSYLDELDAYDSMISMAHQIRRLLKSKPEKESIQTYLLLGSAFYSKRNYDSLVYWQKQAQRLIKEDSPHYGTYLLVNGLKSYLEESYVQAIASLIKAAEYFEANQDHKYLAVTYNNLAVNYEKLDNRTAYQEYLLKAIEINKEHGFINDLISNYNNLGISYRKQNLLEEALVTYDLAYTELKKINSPMLLAQNLTNRANILEKKGDFKTAEKLFLECEQISETHGIAYGVMLSQVNLGNLYRQMKQFDLAQKRLEKALELSEELSVLRERALIFERIAWLARDQQDFEKAYQYITQYYTLNDSLISESVKKDANELKEKYEAEKKELEILALSKNKLYQQFLITLLGMGILALVITLQWWRNKHRTSVLERKQEEERLKFLLELKEKELLADSLKRVSVMNTKDAIYHELKELIKELPKTQSSKFVSILNELKGEQDQSMLEEFETRFLGVYESFFTKLKAIAPDLTPTELRAAALIRLNFTSKEMALITNRSVGTIDNLRSSIRKKLNLSEEDNLLDKLSQI